MVGRCVCFGLRLGASRSPRYVGGWCLLQAAQGDLSGDRLEVRVKGARGLPSVRSLGTQPRPQSIEKRSRARAAAAGSEGRSCR